MNLVCHPQTPDDRVRAIAVTAALEADGGLSLTYRLEGDVADLRIPDAPLPAERLWAHTCFEAFVAQAGAAAYREFNFSPNGQWMRFDFSGYRQRAYTPSMPDVERISLTPTPLPEGEGPFLPSPAGRRAGDEGQAVVEAAATAFPSIRVVSADLLRLQLTARLPAELLPPGDLVLALTAVVEHAKGSLHYWALRHPPGQPDFHHREGFALALKASAQ